jgi:hypothetical protein
MRKEVEQISVVKSSPTITASQMWIINCEGDTALDDWRPYDRIRVINTTGYPITVAINQDDNKTDVQSSKSIVRYTYPNAIHSVAITNNGSGNISAGQVKVMFIKGLEIEIATESGGQVSTYVLDSLGNVVPMESLTDNTVKGLLRSIGDAGVNPYTASGKTLLYLIDRWYQAFYNPNDAITLTTTPLGVGATYISNSYDFDTSRLGHAGVIGYADQNSAENGVVVELSINNSNWDYVGAKTTATANVGVALEQDVVARYIHFKWVNGAVAQGVFRFGGRFFI